MRAQCNVIPKDHEFVFLAKLTGQRGVQNRQQSQAACCGQVSPVGPQEAEPKDGWIHPNVLANPGPLQRAQGMSNTRAKQARWESTINSAAVGAIEESVIHYIYIRTLYVRSK